MTPDGRFVAFRSSATDLVPNDTNGFDDVFVRDMQSGTTERVSITDTGAQALGASYSPKLSSDGRYVAFASIAPLVLQDTNNRIDVYVRDRQNGTTTRVSVSSAGGQGDDNSGVSDATGSLDISGDGQLVVFQSFATNLVPGDINAQRDVFLHDMQTGTTTLVGINPAGPQASAAWPSISRDGRWVAFQSFANLQMGSGNLGYIYLRDLQMGTTALVSTSFSLAMPGGNCTSPFVSSDGRYVAFECPTNDLVPGDFNQASDVFVRDMQATNCERVSLDVFGAQLDLGSFVGGISGDGRYVTFTNNSDNVVPGHSDGTDYYVRDRLISTTRRMSLAPTGVEGFSNNYGEDAPITDDGTTVSFASNGSRLAAAFGSTTSEVCVYQRIDTTPLPYTAFCIGTPASCCNNTNQPWAGCMSSAFNGGGALTAIGNPSVSNDTVQLVAACMPASTSVLFFQGTAQVNGGNGASFGDGLRCVGGSVLRFPVFVAHAGSVSVGHDIGTGVPVSVLGQVPAPGAVRNYQAWYRDPAPGWCTPATFNLTNGITIAWQP